MKVIKLTVTTFQPCIKITAAWRTSALYAAFIYQYTLWFITYSWESVYLYLHPRQCVHWVRSKYKLNAAVIAFTVAIQLPFTLIAHPPMMLYSYYRIYEGGSSKLMIILKVAHCRQNFTNTIHRLLSLNLAWQAALQQLFLKQWLDYIGFDCCLCSGVYTLQVHSKNDLYINFWMKYLIILYLNLEITISTNTC